MQPCTPKSWPHHHGVANEDHAQRWPARGVSDPDAVGDAGATASLREEGCTRAFLAIPCDVTLVDEAGIITELPDVDVLVTMALFA